MTDNPQVELAFTRTHLANERTFAAWLRTGLSIAAAGLAVGKLGTAGGLAPLTARWAGVTLIASGAVAVVVGWWGYAMNYRALCNQGALTTPVARAGVTAVSLVICALLVVALVII